jgi:CO/xanthine dehydrogenase Mo-binding subunit
VPHLGARLKRLDDPRILTGRGRSVDDVTLPRMVHVAFVRSAHAHARLTRETPAPGIAGGYKGAGEGGTAGAPAAILNAVNDALGSAR